jgi:hypothetical protein
MHTDVHALSGNEPTIPVFERAKTVHALDRAATVIGVCDLKTSQMLNLAPSMRLPFFGV